ncbi:MAG: hypothetical protein ACK5AZ_24865 [Bryobacteraceae bacterium]
MPDIAELGRLVKQKYPNAYQDMPDADLGALVRQKYPKAYGHFTDVAAADAIPPLDQVEAQADAQAARAVQEVEATTRAIAGQAAGTIPGMERLGELPGIPKPPLPAGHEERGTTTLRVGRGKLADGFRAEDFGARGEDARRGVVRVPAGEFRDAMRDYGRLLPPLPEDAGGPEKVARGASRAILNVLSPESLAEIGALGVAGASLPVLANLPGIADKLRHLPRVLKALDVTASAAVPAAVTAKGAANLVEGGIPENLEQAGEAAVHALLLGAGAFGAIRAGRETLRAHPAEKAGQRPIRADEARTEASELSAAGRRLAATAWAEKAAKLSTDQWSKVFGQSIPVEYNGKPARIEFAGASGTGTKPGRPSFHLVEEESGKVLFGGSGSAMLDFLRQRGAQPSAQPAQPQRAAPTAQVAAAPAAAPEPAPVATAQPRQSVGSVPAERTGNTAKAKTARGRIVETRYAIVDADELVTSHDTALNENPNYPQELQPRDRSRKASEAQITGIVNNLDPQELGESYKASEGAPIVGPDLLVESGNARTIALKRVYDNLHANRTAYRDWLKSQAPALGLDPALADSLGKPVLVRVRTTDTDRVQFAREANEQTVASMSATETALSDATKLSGRVLDLFQPSDSGEILTRDNRDFVRAFFDEAIPPAERGQYQLPDGSISQAGANRVRNAIFAKAYGDAGAIEKLAEAPDSNIRSITNGMLAAAPRFVQIEDAIAKGDLHELSIADDVAAAARKVSALRESGTKLEDYLDQEALFGDELSAEARDLLGVFSEYGRSGKRIGEVLRAYADLVEEAGSPKQQSMFGTSVPSKLEVLASAVNRVEESYGAPLEAPVRDSERGRSGERDPVAARSRSAPGPRSSPEGSGAGTGAAEGRPRSASVRQAPEVRRLPKLPPLLAGAKPRYKLHPVQFDSDVDRAAYIAAQEKRSRSDAHYVRFVSEATGMSEPEVRAYGRRVKGALKGLAQGAGANQALRVPDQGAKLKTAEPARSAQERAQTGKGTARLAQLQQELRRADDRARALEKARREELARLESEGVDEETAREQIEALDRDLAAAKQKKRAVLARIGGVAVQGAQAARRRVEEGATGRRRTLIEEVEGPEYRPEAPLAQKAMEARAKVVRQAGAAPMVYVNRQALAVIAAAIDPAATIDAAPAHVYAFTMGRQTAKTVRGRLRRMLLDRELTQARDKIRHLLAVIQDAGTDSDGGITGRVIVINPAPALSEEALRGIVLEESAHYAQLGVRGTLRGMLDTDRFLAHPLAVKAAEPLMALGYSDDPDVLTAEIGARLMAPGMWRELGLIAAEAAELASLYTTLLRAHNGGRADEVIQAVLRNFPEAAPRRERGDRARGAASSSDAVSESRLRGRDAGRRSERARAGYAEARRRPEARQEEVAEQRSLFAGDPYPPEKKSSLARSFVNIVRPVESRIADQGPAGQRLQHLIERVFDVGEVNAGKRVARLLDARLDKLSRQERFDLVDALEGRGDPDSDRVAEAFAIVRELTDAIGQEAVRSGVQVSFTRTVRPGEEMPPDLSPAERALLEAGREVSSQQRRPFQPRADYYPHVIPSVRKLKRGSVRADVIENIVRQGIEPDREAAGELVNAYIDFMESGARKDRLIRYLVRSGQARDDAEAFAMLLRFRRRTIKRQGTLEYAREADLPFYDPDPSRVLPGWLVRNSMRLAQVRGFGQDNQKVNRLVKQIRDSEGDAAFVSEALDRILQTVNEPETDEARVSRFLRILQGFKLGLAVIPNVTQGALNTMLAADFKAVLAGMKGIGTKKGRRFGIQSGAALELAIQEMMRHAGAGDDGFAGEALGKFLRATGFTATERLNRIFAANAGAEYAGRMLRRLRVNPRDKRAHAVLGRLGLNPERLLRQGRLSPDDVLMAAKRFSDLTQFRSRPQDLPLHASTPWGKVFFQFKSYIYGQSRLIYRELLQELGAKRFGRAAYALLVLGIVFPFTGDLVKGVRSILTGRKREDEGVERYMDGAMQVGALGAFGDLIESSRYGKAIELLVGPSLGEAGEIVEATVRPNRGRNLTKLAFRRIPLIGQLFANRLFPKRQSESVALPGRRSRPRRGRRGQ